MTSTDGGDEMKTVTLQGATRQDANRRAFEAFQKQEAGRASALQHQGFNFA
jgi:hypothetical protein